MSFQDAPRGTTQSRNENPRTNEPRTPNRAQSTTGNQRTSQSSTRVATGAPGPPDDGGDSSDSSDERPRNRQPFDDEFTPPRRRPREERDDMHDRDREREDRVGRYRRSRISETFPNFPPPGTTTRGGGVAAYGLDEYGFHPDDIPDDEVLGLGAIECVDETPWYLEYRRQEHLRRSDRLGNANELTNAVQQVRDKLAQHINRTAEK